ncbi:MAG TPA: FAD-dependent monooxygenase [Elusimicrobiota bacterium]|nr:FAD-dependent monooxygenase [Elusimicrobiota bacterium]
MSSALRDSHEFVVIGGGPAGSALAALLARQGRDVALLEKDAFPRDKVCGEFLSPEAQDSLRRIDCLEAVLAKGPERIKSAKLFAPYGKPVALPLTGESLGVSRAVLDELLFRHAAQSGAVALEGAQVRAIHSSGDQTSVEVEISGGNRLPERRCVQARIVIGAYGRRSRLDRQLDRPFIAKDHPFIGLKRHHRPRDGAAGHDLSAALRGSVELHAFRDGYGGVSFVEDDVVNVCLLVSRSFVHGLGSPGWEAVTRTLKDLSPTLHDRLQALSPAEEAVHAVAQIGFESKETSSGPLLFVGDAAAMIAPLCGDGQAMALRSAELLADLLASQPRLNGASLARHWDARWRAEFNGRMRIGRLLQTLMLSPWSCAAAIAMTRLVPPVGRRLVAATRG